MSRTFSTPATAARPAAVTIASILMLVVAVSNIAFILFPNSSNDVPTTAVVFGFILGLAGLPVTFGLWRCHRWAMIATVVISVINVLSSAGGIIDGPSTLVVVAATASAIVSAVTIVLVLTHDARESYV